MGGRTSFSSAPQSRSKSEREPDRDAWIRDISDKRLSAYENLMKSSGAPRRLNGDKRLVAGRNFYFADLIAQEKTRRGNKT